MKRSRESAEDTARACSPSPDIDAAETHAAKLASLDQDGAAGYQASRMTCSMPPHREVLSFGSYQEYEVHYNKAHLNRCSACGKNLPSSHLLDIHFEECHDPFIVARRERGEPTVRPGLDILHTSNTGNTV
jgi:hypothetical protein